MDKKNIRYQALESRANIKNRTDKDEIITQRAYELAKSYEIIGIYYAFRDEVATQTLIQQLLDLGKVVACPRIESGQMHFYKVESLDDFSVGHFNVPEPKGDVLIRPEEFDLMFIPMLAFNDKFYRVGYGKGYYDRYLKKMHGLKVGLAYADQFVLDAFEDEYDIACDFILTEKR